MEPKVTDLYNDGVAADETEEPPALEPPHFGFFRASFEPTPHWLVILDGGVIAIEQQYLP